LQVWDLGINKQAEGNSLQSSFRETLRRASGGERLSECLRRASQRGRIHTNGLRHQTPMENCDADARPSLPPQRQVTKQIMQEWGRRKIALRNPPTERMRDVQKLRITQSVPMLDETSAFRPNMPQPDDDEEAQSSLVLTCLVCVGRPRQ
jgi:hypothetical protein